MGGRRPTGLTLTKGFARLAHALLTPRDGARVEPPVGAPSFLYVELLLQLISLSHFHDSSVPKGCNTEIGPYVTT